MGVGSGMTEIKAVPHFPQRKIGLAWARVNAHSDITDLEKVNRVKNVQPCCKETFREE